MATAVVIDSDNGGQGELAALLSLWNVYVAATSADLRRAPALVEAHACDLLFVSVDKESDRKIVYSCLRRAHRLHPGVATVVFVPRDDTAIVDTALAAGAFRAIDRHASTEVIARVIDEALGLGLGEADGVASTGELNGARPRLTRRELEILRLVADGRSNREVAKLLWVTDQTVKFHLGNAYRKLGVRNRLEAGRWAVEHGLVSAVVERGCLLDAGSTALAAP